VFARVDSLTIGGEKVTVDRPVQYRYSNLVAGEKRSQLNVSPAFDVTVDPDIAIFPESVDLPPNRLRQGYGGPPKLREGGKDPPYFNRLNFWIRRPVSVSAI